MERQFNWKKYEFVTVTQTALIANAMRAASRADEDKDHFISSTSMLNLMQTVFTAAEQIPEDVSAHEAASQIVLALCYPENASMPDWFVFPELLAV